MAILNNQRPQGQRNVRVLSPVVGGSYESPDGRVIVNPRRKTPPTTPTVCTQPVPRDPPNSRPKLEVRNWDLWKTAIDQIRTAHGMECQPKAEFEASVAEKLNRGRDEWTYVQHGTRSKLVFTMTNESCPNNRQVIILACAHIIPRNSTVATLTTLAHNAHTSCGAWQPYFAKTKRMKPCCDNLQKCVPENCPLSRPDKRLKQLEKDRQTINSKAPSPTNSARSATNTQQQPEGTQTNTLYQLENYIEPYDKFAQKPIPHFYADKGLAIERNGCINEINKLVWKNEGLVIERDELANNVNKLVWKNNVLVFTNTDLMQKAANIENKYNDLEVKNNDLRLEYNALGDKHKTLEAMNDDLKDKNKDLGLKLDALEVKHNALEATNTALEENHSSLERKYSALEATKKTLEKRQTSLECNNNTLELTNASHSVRNSVLSRENQELKNQVVQLQNRLYRVARELKGPDEDTRRIEPANRICEMIDID